jgi:hypothetical protein
MLLNAIRVLIKGLYCNKARLSRSLAWQGLLVCVSSCHYDIVRYTYRVLVHCSQVDTIILWFILRFLNQRTLCPCHSHQQSQYMDYKVFIFVVCCVWNTSQQAGLQNSSCFLLLKTNIMIFWNRALQFRTTFYRRFVIRY